jgi:exopolyphosphatase/guanosine-5'-triphosphate,3'-diphosphate pyrophosphatase
VKPPLLLAAVDLGSNSFRLEVGRATGSHIERIGYWKETVRLAAGLDEQNRLSRKAIETACECLARMNERLRGMKSEQVRAVGTQTLRVAHNIDEFLLEAQAALGYPIEVIAGREEARLVFEGCMHTLPPSDKRRLVVDIGGASTELIVGRGFFADSAESFKVGCVNNTLRYFGNGQLDRGAFKRAQIAAAAELEEAIEQFSRPRWDEAYGSSGTAGAISEILQAEGWTDGTITADGLVRLKQAMIAAGDLKRLRLSPLKPERQQVLAGGVAVMSAVFDMLGIEQMRTARGALQAGVLYDLLGRRESRDLRDATVDRLQTRFAVDRAQAQRVSSFALQAYRALVATLGSEAREEMLKRLGWAAALHEIGFCISHNDYHKHGAYLVRHGDLAGFSTTDQERVAQLILAQRGNLKKIGPALDEPERRAKIAALRLAVILCHARRDPALPAWSLRAGRTQIDFTVDRDWLGRHPMTEFLLQEETDQWSRVGLRFAVTAAEAP